MTRYYIEAEVSCVRTLEIDADSDAQAEALAEDYMADHMVDPDGHPVTTRTAVRPEVAEDIGARLVASRNVRGTDGDYDPDSYYGYTFAEDTDNA